MTSYAIVELAPDMRILDVIGKPDHSKQLTVRLMNEPPQESDRLLIEAAYLEEAGKEKSWGKGYTYRLDRRPEHQGGDQLHIYRKNHAWAYRKNGTKSEPSKYTLPATNAVKDMVRNIFDLDKSIKIESSVISASEEEIILEINFN